MQLLYPGFLVGLLAIAIPVLIHLLQLRRPRRLLFTNTAFIREVKLVTVRQRNVQRWLLMMVRVLELISLVLMFCQPFIAARRSTVFSTGTKVLVDNSFSMQASGPGQNSLFGTAIARARGIDRTRSTTGHFQLLNNGRAPLSAVAYQRALDELKITAQNSFLKLRRNEQVVNGNADPLYIFSDFQRNAVDTASLGKLANKEVVLVPLVSKGINNLYVDSVWLDDAFVRVRANVGLHIRVRNGGSVGSGDTPVKVFLGARQVAAYRVRAEAGQAVTSVVQVQAEDSALLLGRVVTEDVPVTFDNTHYFTLQPATTIRVLEIGAEPVAQQLYGNEPLFAYSFAKPQNVDYGVLRRANLVMVRELERIDAGLQAGLREVVKRGGSVVVVPAGTGSSHDSYQQLFKVLGVSTVQWEGAANPPELREVAMPAVSDPFFRDVFGAQKREVTMPRVAPVLRWPRTGTDILRLPDGESYLADFASGAGQVYVFSAPFAQQYSDFVSHALFVPVMYRLAMLSYRNDQLPAYRLTQGSVALPLPATEAAGAASRQVDETSFRLVKDSAVLIPAQRVVATELRLELPEGMNEPGFYQLQRGGKVLTTLAFNQDKRESILVTYSADELRQLVGPHHPNIRVVESGADGAGLAQLQEAQAGQPLWRYFLLLALLALLAEALLVRFGGRAGKAVRATAAA